MQTKIDFGASMVGKLARPMGPFGMLVVDESRVNMDDVVNTHREGAIVRVRGDVNTAITYISPEQDITTGCVAGWISEDE